MTDLVLLTGASGFIAKHVALALLERGYAVRGTARSEASGERARATLDAAGADPSRFSIVVADLESDAGWAEAAEGCRYVQHLASPFPLEQPRDREALTPAAKAGAERVLAAGLDAGAERIVMTSSIVSMAYRADRPAVFPVTEDDWTDPDWGPCSPYIISKTRAERAAWALMEARGAREKLVTINPGLVLGPLLDADAGTSAEVARMVLTGAVPAVPPVAFVTVDVRDVAELHVRAMTADVGGRRLIAGADTMTMRDIGAALAALYPERARKIPKRELPAFMVRFAANFDSSLKTLRADLGARPEVDTGYVTALTGVEFRSGADALAATAQSLIEHELA